MASDTDSAGAITDVTAAEMLVELIRHLDVLRIRAEREHHALGRASWEDQAEAVCALIAGLTSR